MRLGDFKTFQYQILEKKCETKWLITSRLYCESLGFIRKEKEIAKRAILAVVGVFIAWSMLDFLIHGLLLQSTYEATANLWRPI